MKEPCLHQSRIRVANAVFFLALTACGGGGGGGGSDDTPAAETLTIDFPPVYSYVEAASHPAITVRGRASADDSIAGVIVNGVAASSDDGFTTWQAIVPLKDAEGENAIEATLELAGGETGPSMTVTVETVPPFPGNIADIAFDPATQRVFVADITRRAVYAWDPEEAGRFMLIAGEDRRTGKLPLDVTAWQLAWDGVGNRVLFGDDGKLFGMNSATGNIAVLSGDGKGAGPDLPSSPPYLVRDEARDLVYAVYSGFGVETSIMRIDLASGDREPVPVDLDVEPVVGAVSAVAFDAAEQRLLLARYTEHDVIVIDLDDGSRSIVTGPALHNIIQDMVFDPGNNDLLFAVNPGSDRTIYRSDLETGEFAVISDNTIGNGARFEYLAGGIAPDGARARLFVADANWNTIFAVDTQTGDRSAVLPKLGTGESAPVPFDLVMNEEGTVLRMVDRSGERILSVPLDGSERVAFVAPDVLERRPLYMTRALDAPVLYVLDSGYALNAVDAVTGEVTKLSVNVQGAFGSVSANEFIVDHGGQQAWFLISGLGDVEDVVGRIDLATGIGEIISGGGKGEGDPLTDADSIVWDPETSRIAVWHGNRIAFVDPVSGDREFRNLEESVNASDLQYDVTTDAFLVADYYGIYRYLPNGGREVVVSRESGKGLAGMYYGGPFIHDSTRGVIYLSSQEFGTIMAIDAVTGAEVILAR